MESKTPSLTAKQLKSTRPNYLLKKRTAAFSRWLHNYLSMFCFLIVLFFAITGFTLNHADWFDVTPVEKKVEGRLSVPWVNLPDTAQVKKLEIVEWFRKNYKIGGYVSDFIIQDDQCMVSFKGPGYSADASINRQDGTFKLTEYRLGLIAIINDLHKGRDSGKSWSYLIDFSVAFLTLISISGLAMLLFLKKKRLNGLLLAVIGGIICLLIYWLWVP